MVKLRKTLLGAGALLAMLASGPVHAAPQYDVRSVVKSGEQFLQNSLHVDTGSAASTVSVSPALGSGLGGYVRAADGDGVGFELSPQNGLQRTRAGVQLPDPVESWSLSLNPGADPVVGPNVRISLTDASNPSQSVGTNPGDAPVRVYNDVRILSSMPRAFDPSAARHEAILREALVADAGPGKDVRNVIAYSRTEGGQRVYAIHSMVGAGSTRLGAIPLELKVNEGFTGDATLRFASGCLSDQGCQDPGAPVRFGLAGPGGTASVEWNGPGDTDSVKVNLDQLLRTCVPSQTRMCLNNGRFAIEGSRADFQGNTAPMRPVQLTADSGYVWFFNESNVEMIVKVLDACALNDRFWVFSSALSNVNYVLKVTDTHSGQVYRVENPAGNTAPAILNTNTLFGKCSPADAGLAHEELLNTLTLPPQKQPVVRKYVDLAAKGPCVPDQATMCLGERFRVRADYSANGVQGRATPVPLTSDSGYLWYFGPDNLEVFTKVLDGCGLNNKYWVFVGGLTDVSTKFTVADTATGDIWELANAAGNVFPVVLDTSGFGSCSANASLESRVGKSSTASATAVHDLLEEVRRRYSSVTSEPAPGNITTDVVVPIVGPNGSLGGIEVRSVDNQYGSDGFARFQRDPDEHLSAVLSMVYTRQGTAYKLMVNGHNTDTGAGADRITASFKVGGKTLTVDNKGNGVAVAYVSDPALEQKFLAAAAADFTDRDRQMYGLSAHIVNAWCCASSDFNAGCHNAQVVVGPSGQPDTYDSVGYCRANGTDAAHIAVRIPNQYLNDELHLAANMFVMPDRTAVPATLNMTAWLRPVLRSGELYTNISREGNYLVVVRGKPTSNDVHEDRVDYAATCNRNPEWLVPPAMP